MNQSRYITIDTYDAQYIIAQALKHAREHEGFSIERLAEVWGVSDDCIKRLESGSTDPHLSEISDYLQALHLKLVVSTEPYL